MTTTTDTKHCAGYPAWGQPPHDDVPLSRFNARPGRKDGLERLCKDCQKAGRAAKAAAAQEETIDARDLRIMAEEAAAAEASISPVTDRLLAEAGKAPKKRTPKPRPSTKRAAKAPRPEAIARPRAMAQGTPIPEVTPVS